MFHCKIGMGLKRTGVYIEVITAYMAGLYRLVVLAIGTPGFCAEAGMKKARLLAKPGF